MKVYYTLAVFIIVVCLVVTFYALYDAYKFRESLPDISEAVSKAETPVVQSPTAAEDGLTERTESADIQPENIESETSAAADDQENENDEEKNNISSPNGDIVDNNPQMVEIPKKKIPYSALQIDQKIAKLREWLVKNHDDPVEIEEFLALEKKRHESTAHFGGDIIVLYMSIEEQIRRAELLVKLYPAYGNENVLNSLIEEKARYDSGEAIPQYMYPIEYWENAAQRR